MIISIIMIRNYSHDILSYEIFIIAHPYDCMSSNCIAQPMYVRTYDAHSDLRHTTHSNLRCGCKFCSFNSGLLVFSSGTFRIIENSSTDDEYSSPALRNFIAAYCVFDFALKQLPTYVYSKF